MLHTDLYSSLVSNLTTCHAAEVTSIRGQVSSRDSALQLCNKDKAILEEQLLSSQAEVAR